MTHAVRYQQGTDKRIDAIVHCFPDDCLWLVRGDKGMKPIWVPNTTTKPEEYAVQQYREATS